MSITSNLVAHEVIEESLAQVPDRTLTALAELIRSVAEHEDRSVEHSRAARAVHDEQQRREILFSAHVRDAVSLTTGWTHNLEPDWEK